MMEQIPAAELREAIQAVINEMPVDVRELGRLSAVALQHHERFESKKATQIEREDVYYELYWLAEGALLKEFHRTEPKVSDTATM